MHVTSLPIDVEGIVQFNIGLLKNDIDLTLSVTKKAGRTYSSGSNWMQIATELAI